jgi:hypothetical protein
MKRSCTIVSYTSEEIREMIARGEDRSDWARANAMTDAEIAAAIAGDPDEAGIVWDDTTISGSIPKAPISIRLDPDVLAFQAGWPRLPDQDQRGPSFLHEQSPRQVTEAC